MTKITIGARSSNLSLAYVSKVKDLLIKNNEELNETDIKVKTITTTGDIKQDVRISEVGGKNLFCKEIEENLLKIISI
jgi:Porphobilinogen deaminase